MGRLPRPTDDGLIFHALNRGNNGGDVFSDDDDRSDQFLESLGKTKERYPFRVLRVLPDGESCTFVVTARVGVVGEPDHAVADGGAHLAVSQAMEDRRACLAGAFQEPGRPGQHHLLTVLRYVEANPLRARAVDDLSAYPWSSFPAHAGKVVNPLVDAFPQFEALGRTPAERGKRWAAKVVTPLKEDELSRIRESSRTGRPLGDAEWVAARADHLGLELNPRPRGRPRKAEK